MKNADMPAMPVPDRVAYELVHGKDGYANISAGLTKREQLAAMAMQGLCVQGGYGEQENMAIDAVNQADALLAELEKDSGNA